MLQKQTVNISSLVNQQACNQDQGYFIGQTKKSLRKTCCLACSSWQVMCFLFMVTSTAFTASEKTQEIARNSEAFMKMIDLIVKRGKNWAAKSKRLKKNKSERRLKETIGWCVMLCASNKDCRWRTCFIRKCASQWYGVPLYHQSLINNV